MTISFQPRFAGYLNQNGQRRDTACATETHGPIIGPLSRLQSWDRDDSVAQRIHHDQIRSNLPISLVNASENRWRSQLVPVPQPVADFLYKHINHCPPEVATTLPTNPKNLSLHFAKMITQYLPQELQHQLAQEQLATAQRAQAEQRQLAIQQAYTRALENIALSGHPAVSNFLLANCPPYLKSNLPSELQRVPNNLVPLIAQNLSPENKTAFWQLVKNIHHQPVIQTIPPAFQYKEDDISTVITTLKQYRNNEKPAHYTIPSNRAGLTEDLKTEASVRNKIKLALQKAGLPVPPNMKKHLQQLTDQDLKTLASQILDTTIDKVWYYR